MRKSVNKKHRQDSDDTLSSVITSNLLSLLKIFLVCFGLVYIMVNYLVRPIHVNGQSMFPTIQEGEFAFSNAFAAKFQDIERGDVVIAYENQYLNRMVIKRVIGLPGDTVYCREDQVYINEEPLNESYLDNFWRDTITETEDYFTEDFDKVTLGEDEYWLLGDNRINSKDSRLFGTFHRSQIKGKGVFIVFPFSSIREIK